MAKNVKELFERMEEEIMKGGGKEENTQPYKRYEDWLSEIEGYIERVVSVKKKEKDMKKMNRKDYEITEERNYPRNKKSNLEKKTREERLSNILSKQMSSSYTHESETFHDKLSNTRGKGQWLI
jgi:hypothetical protein